MYFKGIWESEGKGVKSPIGFMGFICFTGFIGFMGLRDFNAFIDFMRFIGVIAILKHCLQFWTAKNMLCDNVVAILERQSTFTSKLLSNPWGEPAAIQESGEPGAICSFWESRASGLRKKAFASQRGLGGVQDSTSIMFLCVVVSSHYHPNSPKRCRSH